MRSDTALPGRVRLATTLTVVSAVMVVAGGILVATGKRSGDHVTSLGALLGAAGLAVGLVALLVYLSTRGRRSARRGPAGHRHRAAPAGPGRGRRRVLDPTTVYSPGGLIDVPRDARAPGSPGAARPSGLYDPPETMQAPGSQGRREAFRAPMAGGGPRSGPGEARPSAGRMGAASPRPGYQAGAQPATGAAPGWRSASPAARQASPPRDGPPPRPGPPPPFEPGHPARSARPGPFGPAPGRGTGRPSAGSGYRPSAGWRPAPPGARGSGVPGGPGPAGPGGISGGYAQVIRPSEHPGPSVNRVQPSSGQPVSPPADRDVYVYRDASGPAPTSSGRHAAADDAAYWYDLLAEDPAPQHEETRGPFEPLLSSGGTPAGAEPAVTERAHRRPDAARNDSPEASERARARKLEQLKDLYLTAEAIGEQNVDKHFDQLLAQQRQLISEYFRQPAAAKPAAEHYEMDDPGATGRQAGPPEGAGVRAEPPRAW